MALSILTWNVNSVRARLDHVLTYLAEHEPDVVCLQETKVADDLFPRIPFLELGYQVTMHGSKGYAGVATLTKTRPDAVYRGFRARPKDKHCRILAVEIAGVMVYNLYVPNGTELGSEAFAYKLHWLGRLREEFDANFSPADNVVVVGDFNIAPDERDVWDVEGMRGRLHFTDEEHEALTHLLGFGLEDCYRKHQPDGGHYTWFDYRTRAFERGEGLRIDHIYASAAMGERCTGVVQDHEPRGWDTPSDHVPVTAKFA